MPGQMLRTYAFVDGGYLRDGLRDLSQAWQDLNLRELGLVLPAYVGRMWQGLEMQLGRVFVYDAVPEGTDALESDVVRWLDRNAAEADVHVRRGGLVGERRLRQKEVDVQLAVDALSLAANGVYDVALLLSGDRDFVPVVEAVRFRGPLVGVCCFRSSIAAELKEAADRVGYLPEDNAWQGWRLP